MTRQELVAWIDKAKPERLGVPHFHEASYPGDFDRVEVEYAGASLPVPRGSLWLCVFNHEKRGASPEQKADRKTRMIRTRERFARWVSALKFEMGMR
jgi:hypothetical protein